MRRGEGGREGGREKIRKCIVAFLKFRVFLSFPSLFPSPPTWIYGRLAHIGLAPRGNSGPLSPRQTGGPSHHRPPGAPLVCTPSPQPSVPISTRQKVVGIQGWWRCELRRERRCIKGWPLATCCGPSYGSQERCPPCGIGTAAPYCKPNHRQVLEAAKWALELSARPFQQEMRCGCEPTVLGEVRFPAKCRAWAALSPSLLPLLKSFSRAFFFPEAHFPRCSL